MCVTLSSPYMGIGETKLEEIILCLPKKVREEADEYSTIEISKNLP